MNDITKLIVEKTGNADLLKQLDKLSGSELNTLLLELFRNRIKKFTSKDLMKQFLQSRFSLPSAVDAIAFKELEIRCLKLAEKNSFKTIVLSLLTPLGTCSVVGNVAQNNIVSASRGMEVVSDATNVFALMIAHEFKKQKEKKALRYATTHRHVRAQSLHDPRHSAHFSIFCLATGGLDTGNYSFEIENLFEHINVHLSLLSEEFDKDQLITRIYLKEENESFLKHLKAYVNNTKYTYDFETENAFNSGDYYKLVRFKTFLKHNNSEVNLSDGGLVNWTQKLIPNKKHRLFISGVGLELVYKLKRG